MPSYARQSPRDEVDDDMNSLPVTEIEYFMTGNK